MLSDESHGFSHREYVIQSGKENINIWKIHNCKNYYFSFLIACFSKFHLSSRPYMDVHLFTRGKILYPSHKEKEVTRYELPQLPWPTPPSATHRRPHSRAASVTPVPTHILMEAKCSLTVPLLPRVTFIESPKCRWKYLRIIISL